MAEEDKLRRIADLAAGVEQRMSLPPVRRLPPRPSPALDGAEPPRMPRVGLLLAGGAAKGGYELGAIEALAGHHIEIEAIAGSSIGALNGVVLACAPDLPTGARRLADMWEEFSARLGAAPFGQSDADGTIRENALAGAANLPVRTFRLLMNQGYLEQLVDSVIDVKALRSGPPMWVTGFPVGRPLSDLVGRGVQHAVNWLLARLQAASLLHLNNLPEAEIRDAVLASAALPFLFSSRRVGGRYYSDGGLGHDKMPVRAFAAQGHEVVFAVHLDALDLLRERDRAGIKLLEVRPSRPLTPKGIIGGWNGLLDFSPERVRQIRELGYRDATETLVDYAAQAGVVWLRRETQRHMLDAVGQLGMPLYPPAEETRE